jgi:hemerythrin-like metal-binding protein
MVSAKKIRYDITKNKTGVSMSFIKMTDEEIVNVKELDDEHSEMVNLINALHDSLSVTNTQKINALVSELVQNLRNHFETEERLMKEHNFEGYISHKMEHDRFLAKMETFEKDLKDGVEKLTLDTLNSLKRWFFNHIKFNDKKCGEFLASKGVGKN